ncbi:hypothetical protein KC960_04840, partial [Candidatus Saccharibacteria bacterium]|nr:hypothetical protein [Candidatus Saccharibacteria bacterium]
MSLTEFTPRQECIVGSVNMAPKAILHFVCDPDMAYTAGELDELFIKAQGEVPIWAPARSYAANTLGKLPVKNKTFNVDHTRPRTFQLSPEDGVGIARPAALHLTQLALSEGVDIPDLVGESLGSTNNRKSSQAIRYHGIQLLRSLKKADTFTITSLTTELGISPTAATYLIEVLVTPGYLAQDPKCQGTRNVYARYFIPSPNSELIIPDVTFGTRFSDALRHLSDENSPFDAADVAKKMGYNPKYNGDKIAEILKTVNAMGTIQKVDDEAYRDIPYRTTDHGRFVFEVLNWIYNNINDPSKRFLGQA